MTETTINALAKRLRDKARVLLAGADGDDPMTPRLQQAIELLKEASTALDHCDTVLRSVPESVRINRSAAGLTVTMTIVEQMRQQAALYELGRKPLTAAQGALREFAGALEEAVGRNQVREAANGAASRRPTIELVKN